MANGTVNDLKPGYLYRVRKDFTDFYGDHLKIGHLLTFQSYNYLPYDGGFTIKFIEQTIYLQFSENGDILQDLWSYLEIIPSVPPRVR